jgi:transcription initiation factor TFIIIB Brf1 subunit/transcription initiation factor TFIIB
VADIILKCPKCGKENKVSEYAVQGSVVCASCQAPLDIPAAEKAMRLQVRKIAHHQRETLTGKESVTRDDVVTRESKAQETAGVLGEVHKARTKVKTPNFVWALIPFLVLTAGLLGAQYMIKFHPEQGGWMHKFVLGRSITYGLVYLLVLLAAFEDSVGQGALCLFIPPYTLYYVFVRLEAYWLRGCFFAMCLSVFAEVYFVPKQAIFTIGQAHFDNFVETVNNLVQRAGEPPELAK